MKQKSSDETKFSKDLGWGDDPQGNEQPQDGTGEGDLNDLASEINTEKTSNEAEKFEEDFGWDVTEDSEQEEETDQESEEDEEESTDGEESDEESEEEDQDDSEEEDGQDDSEDEEDPDESEDEEEEDQEPEILYDAQRDFPDEDLPPTKYKDRLSLDQGAGQKVSYIRKLKGQLEELDAGLGAIPLPDLFGGDEAVIDQPFDRNSFATMDDEQAKEAIKQLDQTITSVKDKIQRVEHSRQQEQQSQQVTQEYKQAVSDLVDSIALFEVSPDKARDMTQADLLQKADKMIAAFEGEKGKEFLEDHSPAEYHRRMREFEQAKQTIVEFPEKAQQMQQQQEKKTSSPDATDPQQARQSFDEWKSDRPELPIHKDQTDRIEGDFLEWIKLKVSREGMKMPGNARSWDNRYSEYQKEAQEMYNRKEAESKSKKKKAKEKATQTKVKKEKKRPSADKIGRGEYGRNDLKTDDVDSTLDSLAKELNVQ